MIKSTFTSNIASTRKSAMYWNIATAFRQQKRRGVQYEMCKLYSDDALEKP